MAKYVVILPKALGFSESDRDFRYAYSRAQKEGVTDADSPQEAVKNVFWRGFRNRSMAKLVSDNLARRQIRLPDIAEVYLVGEVLDADTRVPVGEGIVKQLSEEARLATDIAEKRGGVDVDYFDEARRLLKTQFIRPSARAA